MTHHSYSMFFGIGRGRLCFPPWLTSCSLSFHLHRHSPLMSFWCSGSYQRPVTLLWVRSHLHKGFHFTSTCTHQYGRYDIICSSVEDLSWLYLLYFMPIDISAATWYMSPFSSNSRGHTLNQPGIQQKRNLDLAVRGGRRSAKEKGFQKKKNQSFVVTHGTRCFTKEKCKLKSTGTKCNRIKRAWQWGVKQDMS